MPQQLLKLAGSMKLQQQLLCCMHRAAASEVHIIPYSMHVLQHACPMLLQRHSVLKC
jgi:hypothetical protein